MAARGNVTIYEWHRHVEELRDVVARHLSDEAWSTFDLYGPDNEGFSSPAVCLSSIMSREAFAAFMQDLDKQRLHLTLPIHVYASADLPTIA